jgi:hypothetical protein
MNPDGQVLTPDKDGYYHVNLGALNVFNTSKEFYAAPPSVLNLFKKDSYAIKRVKQKQLFGEYDHPEMFEEARKEMESGKGQSLWLTRQTKIDMNRVSHHIREFAISKTDKIAHNGEPVYIVDGWIKPHGPFKQVCEDSLKNPNINTAFSVRSIVMEEIRNGYPYLTIIALLTWDLVGSPGILGSTDHGKMGYEFDKSEMAMLKSRMEEVTELVGVEDESSKQDRMDIITTIDKELNSDNGRICGLRVL